MKQYNSNKVMKVRSISENGLNQKNQVMRKAIVLLMFLSPLSLASQISFAEKPLEKGPGWEYMRDIIMMPYDSTVLLIETYPILEAYKKYIGQQLFFMKGSDSDKSIIHKYYEIVDVISYKKFLEAKLQEEEAIMREREEKLRAQEREIEKLREKENELNKTKTELQQDYKKKDSVEKDLRNIEWNFQEIEKKRQMRNLSQGGHKDLRDREKELRKRENVLLKNYDRERVLKELSEIENKLNEIEKELSETEKELSETEKESIKIKDDLKNYFSVRESSQRRSRIEYDIKSQQNSYFFPCEDNPDRQCSYEIKDEDIPCFVLKNTQNQDTIYRIISTVDYARRANRDDYRVQDRDRDVILVGGFIKLKDISVGKNFFFWKHSIGLDPEIASEWECIDVSITEEKSYLQYWYEDRYTPVARDDIKSEVISLTLRNKKKTDLIDYVRYSHITQRAGNHIIGSTSSTITNEKTFKEHELAFNRQKQDYNNLKAQEKAKLKQQLTTKYGAANADKIIAGKFEIGMSKAVCREIANFIVVVDKTATRETWEINNFWTGGATYLYFIGDKLVRIINL